MAAVLLVYAQRQAHVAAQHSASIRLLDASNETLDASSAALSVSRSVTSDGTLPTHAAFDTTSANDTDVRVEVLDPSTQDTVVWAWLESLEPVSMKVQSSLRLVLRRAAGPDAFRSEFVRLVGDEVDLHAPGTRAQTRHVSLRAVVRARYETSRGEVKAELRVARPGRETGPDAARQARLLVHLLRTRDGGPPIIGADVADALRIVRSQIRVANGIWLQCAITFGEPSEVAIEVSDPPPPSLLSIADGDGLPARGDGNIRFTADGRVIGPVATMAGATPRATAMDVAAELRRSGFSVALSVNLKTRFGAGPSADLVVRRRDGGLALLSPDGGRAVGSDTRQSARIGVVDLLDGLQEFDNMTAQAGSLEERALIKALADDDPSTIDVFLVNRFTAATRQGEAFITSPNASIVNAVVLDRQGLRHLTLAWTLAHEVGHVLMNDPLHPDNVGPDRPWLLMDADNSRGTVLGPKRLRAEDCRRIRSQSDAERYPLLLPYTVHDDEAAMPAPSE